MMPPDVQMFAAIMLSLAIAGRGIALLHPGARPFGGSLMFGAGVVTLVVLMTIYMAGPR